MKPIIHLVKRFLRIFLRICLSKIISIWKLNGSISSAILWRTLRQFGIIDSLLEPEGHKISFNDFFNKQKRYHFTKI